MRWNDHFLGKESIGSGWLGNDMLVKIIDMILVLWFGYTSADQQVLWVGQRNTEPFLVC